MVRLVTALLLGAALAGCLGGENGGPAGPALNETATETTAPDGRTLLAFEETNMTEEGTGGMAHDHDMWNGADRVVLFEMPAMMEPLPDGDRAFTDLRPPQGRIVYEATETVELTISNPRRHACEGLVTFGNHYYCTDYLGQGNPAAPPVDEPNPPQGLFLRYKHAATVEWIDAGPLTWDAPTAIQVTHPTHTDMPHATSSAWEFQVESPNAHDTTLVFDVKVEIVRGTGDVPPWPGHPLFYTPERPSRTVVDTLAWACDTSGCAVAGGDVVDIVPALLVSYGTRTLHVWANVTQVETPNPVLAPTAWFLYHSNATGGRNITNPFDFANYGIEKTDLYWILPVDDGAMDSPYADGSKWAFSLGASYTSPDNPAGVTRSCYGGCAAWAAEYSLVIHATSEVLAPEQYHVYCLDPAVSHCG